MRILPFILLTLLISYGCKENNEFANTLPEEANLFYNVYILTNDGNRIPRGLYISKKDDGSFYGKFFNPMREKDIYDVHLIKASKDTLEIAVEGIEVPWIITDLKIWDRKATLISFDKYYKTLELQSGPLAAQTIIDYDEDLYNRILNDGKSIKREKPINKTLPEFSDVRGLLINSKDPNKIEDLLGEPNEIWDKRLITYSLYYFKAIHNGKEGHIKVTYDNGYGIRGRVEDVSFHNLGDVIPVGRYSSIKSPK